MEGGAVVTSSGRQRARLRSGRLLARTSLNNKNARGPVRAHSLRNNANHRHFGGCKATRHQVLDNAAFANHTEASNNGNNTDFKITRVGLFTREVYNAICLRIGHTLHIPEDSVQALFNEMHLYPSKMQVSKMLQFVRQYGGRNGGSNYITFGEFCVLVREMQKQYRNLQHGLANNSCTTNCQVFLGGSCNPTTWRADTAIPELQKHGITFYNPQVSMWVPELVAQEHDAKQAASVLLFVVDSQTRSTVGMIEVAYLVASGRCVVLVAHPYKPNQSIMGENITTREYRDLVEGQNTLLMLVKSRGLRVHGNLPTALQSTANILRNCSNGDMTADEQLTCRLRKLRDVFNMYSGQNGDIKVGELLGAFEQLNQRELKTEELFEYLRASNEKMSNRISFEEFCVLMAEFSTDNLERSNTNARTSQIFQRQSSPNNNTCNMSEEEPLKQTKQKSTYDVFLGGTQHSASDWRRDVAIPALKKHGILYYNPALRDTNDYEVLDNGVYENNTVNKKLTEQAVLEQKEVMDASKVLLFVITDDTRSLTTMIMAAHYIGLGRRVVLCIQQLPENECAIHNETLSTQAIKDYNRGRVYVADMAKRKQVPVFENITEAVQCVVDSCQSSR